MWRQITALFVLLGWAGGITSQAPCILRVVDDETVVPGAIVWLDGRPVGATNVSGSTHGWKALGAFGFKRSDTMGVELEPQFGVYNGRSGHFIDADHIRIGRCHSGGQHEPHKT